ncbi:MAG TPA: FmdB family zinc ribbon protein [Actinomycetota bacterium]|nr:FmdB family zinc ribbon protein [Actinomycetota bacterium]
MPTYEYRCTSCENRFEVFQRIDEDPLRVCERCGGPLRKVFHPAGIVFRGSGFYATDSRKAAATASKDGDGSGSGGGSKEAAKAGDGGKKSSDAGSGSKPSESKAAGDASS